jgi:hypothetical protein
VALAVVVGVPVVVVAVLLAWLAASLDGTPVDDPTLQVDPGPARRALESVVAAVPPGRFDVRIVTERGEQRTNGGIMGGSPEQAATATAQWRADEATSAQVGALVRRIDAALARRGWRVEPVARPVTGTDVATGRCPWLSWSDADGVAVAGLDAAARGAPPDVVPPDRPDVELEVTIRDVGEQVRTPRAVPAGTGAGEEALGCLDRWITSDGSW